MAWNFSFFEGTYDKIRSASLNPELNAPWVVPGFSTLVPSPAKCSTGGLGLPVLGSGSIIADDDLPDLAPLNSLLLFHLVLSTASGNGAKSPVGMARKRREIVNF